MSANTMKHASIVVGLLLIGIVLLLSLDNHPKSVLEQFTRSLRQIQQQERRRLTRRVNTGCIEKVESDCASSLIDSLEGEELMKGLLSTCGLQFLDEGVNLNRGWLYQWLLVDFLMVNYQNKKRYVCFDNSTDTATEIGGTASGWNTRPDLSYEIGTTPGAITSSNPCMSWDFVNYTVRTDFWPSFSDAPYHNTYFYLGNGVFGVERYRWGNTLTQVGLPLDTNEVPKCMAEEDEDGYFIWEDTIGLNPMLPRDPFTIMKNVFGIFLAIYDTLTLNQDFIDEELTCDSLE